MASRNIIYLVLLRRWGRVSENLSGTERGEQADKYFLTSSSALMRFCVDLLISPPAGGIPLPGVKKAVLGPGCPFTSTV